MPKNSIKIKEFISNIKNPLPSIQRKLYYKFNIIEEKELHKKNYLKIEEIKNELEKINNLTLDERKNLVIKELNDIDNNNNKMDIKQKYLYFCKMLIKDNTNKNLLFDYLNFIKSNDEELLIIFNENYEKYES